MGKLTYSRSRYYIPYEYSHHIGYKNKNTYKYILFKLLSILLDEMFYSIKCYRLSNRKCKYKYSINMDYLSSVQLFIHKLFNFICYYESNIFHSLPSEISISYSKKSRASHNLFNSIAKKNLLYTSIKHYNLFQANNSSSILFIKLLLLLLFRRDMLSFNIIHVRNIIYEIRQISNYIFFDRYKETIFSISHDILNYDLRKLIISSIFSIRRYANRHRFLNKRPILDKISFLIILSTKRFDKLKRSKLNRTFYSYKLQFKQIFKNIYNFKTTKKYNQYIKKINSKLVNNVNTFKLYLYQIHTFINNNFFFYKLVNKPKMTLINGYLSEDTNMYHHFLIGDQIEVFYNTYKYIHSIRKLYISFLLSQLFYNCCSNFFFIRIKDSRNTKKVHLNKYTIFLNRDLDNSSIYNSSETNMQEEHSIIDLQKKIIQIRELKVKYPFVQAKKFIKLLKTGIKNKRMKKKIKIKKHYQYVLINRLIVKIFNLYNISIYKYYIRRKRYRKLINLCKKYIIRSTKNINRYMYYQILKKLRNIKKGVHIYKYGLLIYNRLLYKIYNILNIYPKNVSIKTFNKYHNHYYHFIESNNNIIRNYATSSSFSGVYILLPMLIIYKYYANLVINNLSMQIKIGHNSNLYIQYCEFAQLFNDFINSHLNYIFSISKYNMNSNLDFQINYSIIKQLSSNIYKNFLISLFMKLSNSIFSLFFKFNAEKKFQINSFLVYQLGTFKVPLINNINSMLNSSCLSKLPAIGDYKNKNASRQFRLFNLFNMNSKNDYLSKIYYFLCNYLILEILFLIKNNYIRGLKFLYTNTKFINKSIMYKFQLLPKLIHITNAYYIQKSLRIAFIIFKSVTHFRKLFNIRKYPFIIFKPKQQLQEDHSSFIRELELEEYKPQEVYLHTSEIMEIIAELVTQKQKRNVINLQRQLTASNIFSFELFNFKLNKFAMSTILSSINRKTISNMLKLHDPLSNHNIEKVKKYFYLLNKIKIFESNELHHYTIQSFINYYLSRLSNKYFQSRQYHITVPLLDFDFKLALKDIKVNKQKSIINPEYTIKYTDTKINELASSYKKNKGLSKVTMFNSTFKFFITWFKSSIKVQLKKQNFYTKNLNLRIKSVKKHSIIKKLYFEYLDKLDLCLNIRISITLFTLLNDMLDIVIGTKSLDSIESKLSIYNMQNKNINKYRKRHLNLIFDNFLMNYYYRICPSSSIKSNYNKVNDANQTSYKGINTKINWTYTTNIQRKDKKKFIASLHNQKKLPFKYAITKSYPKVFLNKRHLNSSLLTKFNNFILQYNYLKYLKQYFTRVIVNPLYYKLTAQTSNSINDVLEISNIKEYLQFRTHYINKLHIIFKLSSYLHIIRENKLKFILYSDPYFSPETNNVFSDIDLTKVSTDIRYLFNEKNYHSITTKYR